MIRKIFILFTVFLGSSFADYGYPQHGGHSNSFRKQDVNIIYSFCAVSHLLCFMKGYGNYAFGYDIVDPKGAMNYRKESGDAWGNKVGSYGIHDIDGRLRIVDYVADEHGFRAKIRTNEPGTASKDSAAATVNGPDHAGYSQTHVAAGHVAPQYNKGAYDAYGHGGLTRAYGHAYPHYANYGTGHGHHQPYVYIYNYHPDNYHGHYDGYHDGHYGINPEAHHGYQRHQPYFG
ncbi:uncharacterized protein B4U79_07549 [Dinothrombium tinctorium]|uniref:Adult-specific rigid cuticular protein 15.7-like protein n=1 Tax=Dinothrombium tinctorium TaxID=1965070 RepID=A0A443R541_9ACAR|nr:uncharacterized protein B4U79_07549 [Dinothrombium tinctorium]